MVPIWEYSRKNCRQGRGVKGGRLTLDKTLTGLALTHVIG
jgi:hypothetical protein